ncbi:hypothetical protein [Nocardia carnea]|uniref:hypothetical protein n=1 Tax=Nocardia carnea TaxID=37328 RepID=UPI002453AA54|nr:hypothetical protein [Nocardia carnea]
MSELPAGAPTHADVDAAVSAARAALCRGSAELAPLDRAEMLDRLADELNKTAAERQH